jgi:hypothetical protein
MSYKIAVRAPNDTFLANSLPLLHPSLLLGMFYLFKFLLHNNNPTFSLPVDSSDWQAKSQGRVSLMHLESNKGRN